MEQLVKQYQLLTDWFLSVLDGVSDSDGNKTINNQGNSLEWLAGHLVIGRYRNMLRIGLQIDPYKHIDKFQNVSIPPPNAIAFSSAINYPSLSACKEQWVAYSTVFLNRLNVLDDSTLKAEIPFTVPMGGNTVEDALNFVVMHEAYHIGQMSIIRKSLGYQPMVLGRRK